MNAAAGNASPVKTAQERLAWATAACRDARIRLTPVREAILSFLARQRMPATLEMVSHADGVQDHCDATTVYRTLMLFKEADLVRLVGTPRKLSHFVLNVPGENNYFLICRRCGCIAEMPLSQPTAIAIQQVAEAQGFAPTRQDCEVYGLCETCQSATRTQIVPSKLMH